MHSGLKLLFVSPYFPYHRHGFVLDELRVLAQCAEVHVLSLRRPKEADWEWLASSGWDQNFEVHWPSSVWGVAPGSIPATAGRWAGPLLRGAMIDPRFYKVGVGVALGLGVARWAKRLDVSWIHADFTSLPGTVADTLSLATDRPFSLMAHAFDVFSTIPAGRATEFALAEKARRARLLFAENSAAQAAFEHALRRYAVDKPVHRKKNAIQVPELPADLDWARRGKIGCFGALVDKKGVDVVIDAVAALRRAGCEVSLELFGDGPLRSKLEAQARSVGCPVCFHGRYHRQELAGFLSSVDVVVMGSRVDAKGDSDGTPTVIMEAYAHGRPVVGTDVGAIADLVRPGVNGFLVPPDDASAMREALEPLLASEELRREYGLAGRRVVEQEFSIEREVEGFLALVDGARVGVA